MNRNEIEKAKRRLIEINKMPNSGKLIDGTNSKGKIDSGQYQRFEKLRKLALEVGGSFISKERQKTANEGELTEGIHRALQTAAMIDACRTASRNFWIAIVAAMAAVLMALSSLIGVVISILVAIFK
jgi:hypothetical protein